MTTPYTKIEFGILLWPLIRDIENTDVEAVGE